MARLSRREFLRNVAIDAGAAGLVAAHVATVRAKPLGLPIGSQTYPHRALLKHDFPDLLKQLAGIGVQEIELCSPLGYADFAGLTDGRQVKRIIADHGLACTSAHFGMRELRERQADSIAWASDVGITRMFTATLGAGSRPTMDDVKRAADEYNRIAAVAAKAGMQQGLHNEGFELTMVDGRRTYDVLLDLLDPKLVTFQFQMSTISRGFVAAEYFMKYPGRFSSMHLQDVSGGAGASGGTGEPAQVAVGKGSIDWVKTFTAARIGGVKSYFVEQNMELTKQSVAYLKTLEVK